MADSKIVKLLDEKLIENSILDSSFSKDYSKVHKKMNSIIKKTGKILSDEIFKKGDSELREWLLLLYKKGASQEKLTSYLRCGLAHLSFDFIESSYKQISNEDLITRTLQSFAKRKYNKTFFKAPKVSEEKTSDKKKIKAVKKKIVKAVKKDSTKNKKNSEKNSVKKISSAKKTTKKKVSQKKVAAKKGSAKNRKK